MDLAVHKKKKTRSRLLYVHITRRGGFPPTAAAPTLNFAASTPTSSTTFDKMQKDKRYAPANEVPAEVLAAMGSSEVFSPGFSIKGQALEGRASYLVREQEC